MSPYRFTCYFFFNDTATTEIYTLSLHDALPISPTHPRTRPRATSASACFSSSVPRFKTPSGRARTARRSEEHTSELQSRQYLVCRLLLEKKKERRRDDVITHISQMYILQALQYH